MADIIDSLFGAPQGLNIMVGGKPVAMAESCKIECEEPSESGWSKGGFSFEASAELSPRFKDGMLRYLEDDDVPVQMQVEREPKKIPRKIKKALHSLWHGTRWQQKAVAWYKRNFYTMNMVGHLDTNDQGEASFTATQYTDSRSPNELVMTKAGMNVLSGQLLKELKEFDMRKEE